VAHRDDGKRMFNFSEMAGTTSTVVLANTYRQTTNAASLQQRSR